MKPTRYEPYTNPNRHYPWPKLVDDVYLALMGYTTPTDNQRRAAVASFLVGMAAPSMRKDMMRRALAHIDDCDEETLREVYLAVYEAMQRSRNLAGALLGGWIVTTPTPPEMKE